MSTDVPDDELIKAAREALTRPDDFGYYGDLPLFETWGFVGYQDAASDTIQRSNYRVMLGELQDRAVHDDGDQAEDASDYVEEVHVSHWLVGSADHIAVRVLDNEDAGVTVNNLTATFVTAVELALSLQDSPILDESDLSELESEEQEAQWDSWLGSQVLSEICGQFGVDDIAELTVAAPDVKFDGWTTVGDLCADSNEDRVREAYYRHSSTEWVEEGTSFHNGRHENVVKDLIGNLFVHRVEQIERAHADAIREDTERRNEPNQLNLI